MLSSCAFIQAGKPALVYAAGTAGNSPANNAITGHIYITAGNTTTQLTSKAGDYDCVSAVCLEGKTYIVFVRYENRCNTIVVKEGIPSGQETALTAAGKFFNPQLAIRGNELAVVWENRENGGSFLEYSTIETGNFFVTGPRLITPQDQRCYCPSLVHDNDRLVLGYEKFDGARYILEFRSLAPGQDDFSHPVTAGMPAGNDTSVTLFAAQGEVYFAWENSSPIDTDYTWVEQHTGTTLTFPAFGHGWRIRGSIGVGKLTGQELTVQLIEYPNGENALQREESCGQPQVFIVHNTLFLLYMKHSKGNVWGTRLELYTGNGFEETAMPLVLCTERTAPSMVIENNTLHMAVKQDDAACGLVSYRLPAADSGARFSAVKPYVQMPSVQPVRGTIALNGERYNLYWGDLHMHSNISLCSRHPRFHCSEVYDKHRFSRDVGMLDFDLLTDHDMMNNIEWQATRKAAHLADTPGSYVSYVGYEWTATAPNYRYHPYGHYNVLYLDDGPLYRIDDGWHDLNKLWAALEPGRALTIPHHPGEGLWCMDWNYFSPEFEQLVEIFQVRGSYEYDQCRMHPELYGRTTTKNNSIQTGLQKGYRFGFTSGGEHEGVGITGVYAKELTREGIFEALYSRRVFGSTIPNVFIDFRVDGVIFGSVNNHSGPHTMEIAVKGSSPLSSVVLVMPDTEHRITTDDKNEYHYNGPAPFAKTPEWVYLRVEFRDGNTAWTSPVFFDLA